MRGGRGGSREHQRTGPAWPGLCPDPRQKQRILSLTERIWFICQATHRGQRRGGRMELTAASVVAEAR